jgi:hypothetical protein
MNNDNLNNALKNAGKLIKNKLRVAALNKGHKATGKLDKSFDFSVVAQKLDIFSKEYAKAVSEGIEKDSRYNKSSTAFRNSLIEWAKAKGIAPRDKKTGKFITYMKMASAMAIGIRRNGISKRFQYRGSGFIKEVENQMQSEIINIINEGYKKDLINQLNKINKER